jgi:hypothetical protein
VGTDAAAAAAVAPVSALVFTRRAPQRAQEGTVAVAAARAAAAEKSI